MFADNTSELEIFDVSGRVLEVVKARLKPLGIPLSDEDSDLIAKRFQRINVFESCSLESFILDAVKEVEARKKAGQVRSQPATGFPSGTVVKTVPAIVLPATPERTRADEAVESHNPLNSIRDDASDASTLSGFAKSDLRRLQKSCRTGTLMHKILDQLCSGVPPEKVDLEGRFPSDLKGHLNDKRIGRKRRPYADELAKIMEVIQDAKRKRVKETP